MKNGLPDSAEKTQAEIEFYNRLKSDCNALRIGERIEFCEVAVREMERCESRLDELKAHLRRFSRRSRENAQKKIAPANA